MAKISDVAKLAGLSVSTVSRVINNQKYVTEDKRKAVLKAMEELNYQPSKAARQLRGQSSKILGVIVPRITNPFFSYLVDEIQNIAYQNDFQIMVFQSNEDKEKEISFLNLLSQKQIDGVIMCAIENKEEIIKQYTQYGPIVLCNEKLESAQLPTISLDQKAGAYLGTEYLLKKGYKKMAYCTGGLFLKNGKGRNRDNGFIEAMKEYNIKVDPKWIFTDQHTVDDGKNIARKIFSMTDRPEAIFTGSDEVAAGLIIEGNKLGIEIPKEIAVLGFDGQLISELTSPSITTVKQPIKELGKQTVELMLSILNKNEYKINYNKLEMNLVIRESA